MNLNKIILRNASKFSVVLKNWGEERGYEIEEQDGKVESPKDEVMGSRMRAAARAKKK